MKRKIKVILDTNIWISFLISNSFNDIDKLLFTGKVTLLFSEESIAEFIDVIGRKKLKRYFSEKDIGLVFDLIESYGELLPVKSKVDICRDKEDNFLLSLAKDGKADYLITGDEDLLSIEKFEKTKIISFTNFRKKYA